MENPFRPAFGAEPPVLIGRADVLDDVKDGLIEAPGTLYRNNKVTGPRGSGKTVLLEAAADMAKELGWIAVNVTASSDLMPEILEITLDRTSHLRDRSTRKLAGATVGPVGITLGPEPMRREAGWRVQMERVLDSLAERGTGLLFTVDEVSARHQQLQTFGKRYQHFQREGRNVALLIAGLPLNVSAFEQLPDTSFIRRAVPHQIGELSIPAVRRALRETFASAGRPLEPAAARLAAEATEGYPFLVQLVGDQVWRRSAGAPITAEAARAGIRSALALVEDTVLATALADLSASDKKFLLAMAGLGETPRMAEITARAGWTPEQSNVYRSRLINAGMVRPAGHGKLEFAFPRLEQYLIANADRISWTA